MTSLEKYLWLGIVTVAFVTTFDRRSRRPQMTPIETLFLWLVWPAYWVWLIQGAINSARKGS